MSAADLLLKQNVDTAGYFAGSKKIPTEPLAPGEQFRFHFNASKCIGCECCVVACNEQNGNPAEVNWRKTGQVEGGHYPNTKRYTLSMGCNHCLEPACLLGCPTDAYLKDTITGIVSHKDEECIGCQYCIWNCPYGVPQFHEERGIVTKCDMCHGRLGMGDEPACVAACPEEAITIEKVNVEEWRREHAQADAPGMPDSSHTLSTTRITFPEDFPTDIRPVDEYDLQPEHPHTPLVFMTVLTQLSVGAFFSLWLIELLAQGMPSLAWFGSFMSVGAPAALLIGGLALNVSVLHLGRPLKAYKALRMWRRSWLSREILFFGIFSGLAAAYAGLWMQKTFLGWWLAPNVLLTGLGGLVALAGAAGLLCSGFIYMVPARPSWNTPNTPIKFFLTGLVLGPLLNLALLAAWHMGHAQDVMPAAGLWLGLVIGATALQLGLLLMSLFALLSQEQPELSGTAILLTRRFKNHFVFRLAATALGGMAIPGVLFFLMRGAQTGSVAVLTLALIGLALCLAGELIGRYLFFVTVVPKNMAGSFFKK